MPAWDFGAVQEAFAETALNPALWVRALETVTAVTESHGAILVPTSNDALATIPFTDRMSGSVESYIQHGWNLRDERNRGKARMVQRGVVDDLDIFDFDTIKQHPYYQEFLAPHRLRWFAGVKISCGVAPMTLDEILEDNDELLSSSAENIFTMRHARPASARPDKVSGRKPCKDFSKFAPLFNEVVADLASGKRKSIKFAKEQEISAGNFFHFEWRDGLYRRGR
jgi:hypothetical protein